MRHAPRGLSAEEAAAWGALAAAAGPIRPTPRSARCPSPFACPAAQTVGQAAKGDRARAVRKAFRPQPTR